MNPGCLFPCETIVSNDEDAAPSQISRQLRPEWIINNSNDEVAEGYIKQTWRSPTRCVVCGQFIQDFEYYFYEKRNLDKNRTIMTQLY